MRVLISLLAIAALVAFFSTVGASGRKGSIHLASGTTDSTVVFVTSVTNLSVAPATANIVVLHNPHYANQDSFLIKAGDVMTWGGLGIYGFTIDRTSATVVDVYWW